MNSLRLSSQAMKRAGIGVGVQEAETVMNELDDQIREASEVTTVLATPLVSHIMMGETDEDDVDAELGLIADEDKAILASLSIPDVPAPDPQERPKVVVTTLSAEVYDDQ